MARLVVPGLPHHVTQRGNRRLETFFGAADYAAYVDLMARSFRRVGTEVWAYCLMPNHVHLVLVPSQEDGLRAALAEAHRRYTRRINLRQGWRGHLWQERFHSFAMDDAHLMACARYVELNPVRAGLVARPEDWSWSSARAHLAGADDRLARVVPLIDRIGDWRAFLADGVDDDTLDALRQHSRTGRPLGSRRFLDQLEARLGRPVHRKRPGPKPKHMTTALSRKDN
jgi:putative transposase